LSFQSRLGGPEKKRHNPAAAVDIHLMKPRHDPQGQLDSPGDQGSDMRRNGSPEVGARRLARDKILHLDGCLKRRAVRNPDPRCNHTVPQEPQSRRLQLDSQGDNRRQRPRDVGAKTPRPQFPLQISSVDDNRNRGKPTGYFEPFHSPLKMHMRSHDLDIEPVVSCVGTPSQGRNFPLPPRDRRCLALD
jgi:hypothetical protein